MRDRGEGWVDGLVAAADPIDVPFPLFPELSFFKYMRICTAMVIVYVA